MPRIFASLRSALVKLANIKSATSKLLSHKEALDELSQIKSTSFSTNLERHVPLKLGNLARLRSEEKTMS